MIFIFIFCSSELCSISHFLIPPNFLRLRIGFECKKREIFFFFFFFPNGFLVSLKIFDPLPVLVNTMRRFHHAKSAKWLVCFFFSALYLSLLLMYLLNMIFCKFDFTFLFVCETLLLLNDLSFICFSILFHLCLPL